MREPQDGAFVQIERCFPGRGRVERFVGYEGCEEQAVGAGFDCGNYFLAGLRDDGFPVLLGKEAGTGRFGGGFGRCAGV